MKKGMKKRMKKRLLPLLAALCALLAITAGMAGCSGAGGGGGDPAGSTAAVAATASVAPAAGGQGAQEDSGGGPDAFADRDPASYSGAVTLWAFDKNSEDAVVAKFNEVFPNLTVDVVAVGYPDYMNKVQTTLAGGGELADIVKAEYGFRAQMQALDIYDYLDEAPYNLDRSLVMDYEVPVSSFNGHIVGIENSINSAGFAYKVDLAEKYLGTSDPDEIEAMLPTWDAYIAKGREVFEQSGGGVRLIAAWGDVSDYTLNWGDDRLTEGNRATDYLLNALPEKRYRLLGEMLANNVVDKAITQIYDPAYLAAYADDSHIFFLCSTWHETAYIDPNDGDTDGRWRLITPPDGPINLGGTNDGIWKGSPNKELAWQYLKWISLSEEGGEACIGARGYYIPYKPFIAAHDFSKDSNPFFGAQNVAQAFVDFAPDVKVRMPERYFNQIGDSFAAVELAIVQGQELSLEQYKELVRQEIMNNCPELDW
jgi:multiple sugar transport system substrate-binding protein